jgi:hypothetical protein
MCDYIKLLNMVFFMVSILLNTIKPSSLLDFGGRLIIEWE